MAGPSGSSSTAARPIGTPSSCDAGRRLKDHSRRRFKPIRISQSNAPLPASSRIPAPSNAACGQCSALSPLTAPAGSWVASR
jgi:hypothetical protein